MVIRFIKLPFLLSDQLFSLFEMPLFSGQLKIIFTLAASRAFLISYFKTDLLIGEINYNLSPFKITDYLKFDFGE